MIHVYMYSFSAYSEDNKYFIMGYNNTTQGYNNTTHEM